MTRITGLLQATWRGVPFFVKSEGMTESGRRIILHDYPNSNHRYVEDLGEIPPKFSVDAFVSGSDFVDQADRLEKALKEPGQGRLTLPVFGAVTVYAMPYKKDASQQSVGEISFSLEFVRGESISGPVEGIDTTETVYAAGDDARVAIGTSLEKKWVPPWDYATSLVAQFDVKAVLNSVAALDTILSNVTDFTQAVGFIELNVAAAIQTGTGLKTTLVDNLFQTISEGLSGGLGLISLLDLIGFGSGDDFSNCTIYGASSTDGSIPLWPDTTESRKNRNTNRLNSANTVRVCALVNAYEQAADKTYNTVDEIEQTRADLEKQHNQIMRIDTENGTLVQSSPAVRKAVEKVRIASLSVMSEKEQSSYLTTEISSASPVSAFVLAYQLYGDTDQTETIRALNPGQPSNGMSGNIKVLQA